MIDFRFVKWPLMAALCGAGLVSTGHSQTLAFPGAEGFGRFSTGGRGGSVYHVTNLNDSGSGSFRQGVTVANRTIVFDVGGVIRITNLIDVAPGVTIAGQTAPGDGITIHGNRVSYSDANNTITRFIRCRMGASGDGQDAIGIADGHDMIFDHCSVSWGQDETFSINGPVTNITIQSTIISQGLKTHSAGGLIQTDGGVSILRSFYIDHNTRNPKVKGTNEYINNVVYNWASEGYIMGESAGPSCANVIGNYFINGPDGNDDAFVRGNGNFRIYAPNNYQDKNRNGVLDGVLLVQSDYKPASPGDPVTWVTSPFAYPTTNTMPPLTALKFVISDTGASWKRDAVDERMFTELTSYGTLGELLNNEFEFPMNGPGIIRSGVVPLDSDKDGMPDYWEAVLGMSTNAANNNDLSAGGYRKLEDYINWLAELRGVALTNTPVHVDLWQFTRGFTNSSPVYSVTNATNGTVTLVNGHYARFVPDTDYAGHASFDFSVVDADSSTVSRKIKLFFAPLAPSVNPIWRGDAVANNWDTLGDHNWFDGQSLLYPFHTGDNVTFDDTGYRLPAVNLVGSLQPSAVTVNAAQNYVFGGSGSLIGSMVLYKAGIGTLTLSNMNAYTGASTVSNGTLLVHGALTQSPVTARTGGSVGGSGSLGNGLTVLFGGLVVPGNGVGAPGTLTITNGLTESGGATNRFDFSDDPTGTSKTNDQINVIGNLTLNGTNTVKVSLLDGVPGDGVYTLFTYTGSFIGNLSDLRLSGAVGTFTNPPGAIAIIVSSVRPPADLVWAGNGANNLWDTGTSVNWLNDGAPDRFYFLDTVLFDDTGSTNPPVNLVGDQSPDSVTVNATVNYTFSGSGKITGTTGLTKTNTGTLTVLTTNDYTGVTAVGGVLTVSRLANGGNPSGIGASGSEAANLVLREGTLRYTGASLSTDRGISLNGNGGIDIASAGTTLTMSNSIFGSGTFIKSGAGTLTLTTTNPFAGGVVLSNGVLALGSQSANNSSGWSGLGATTNPVVFAGGTLQLYGYGLGTGNNYNTILNPLIVPAGQTGTLRMFPRGPDNSSGISSSLSGGGTFNFVANYVRDSLEGNWSAFTGLINVTGFQASSNEFRINNTFGYAGATIFLNNNIVMDRAGSSSTIINIGALGGVVGSVIGPGASSSGNPSWRVGWNNSNATFAGLIRNDGTTTIVKVGTGTWTLTGANTYSGGTTISNGMLLANNTTGSATGSGAVTVYNGGTLGGTGSVSGAVTVNSGGAVAPGASAGTLTMTSSLTLNSGSLLKFELGPTNASDKIAVTGALTSGGTLNVTNLAGFGAGTYTLITYGGAFSGSLPAIGTVPGGFNYTLTNVSSQIRLIVEAAAPSQPPVFGNISAIGGSIQVSGSNGALGGNYYVLTSTNVALPSSNWTRIATNQFTGSGTFSFTNTILPGEPLLFYRLQLP